MNTSTFNGIPVLDAGTIAANSIIHHINGLRYDMQNQMSGLRHDMQLGFNAANARIDTLEAEMRVCFAAVVTRLERSEADAAEREVRLRNERIESEQKLRSEQKAFEAEVKDRFDKLSGNMKWGIGVALTVSGLMLAAFGLWVQHIVNGL